MCMANWDPSNRVTYFAESDFRNKRTKFGIKRMDRARHMYVIGKTGMGKSTMLENLAIQDIQNGEGICFIDPHGGTAEKLLDYVPADRIQDVLYFAPFDIEYPVAFNVMEDVGADRRHLVANGLMSAFKKIWVDAWSARMEYILNNCILALLEYPNSTLLGVNRMLADKDFRNAVVANISDPSVRSFWVDEFAKYGDKYMQEAGASIQNKVGQFVSNPLVRNLIGQPRSTFDVRKMMDERKILIANMSKGQVGEQNANLIGSMLITKIYLAAMSRANLQEKALNASSPFYLFVDEFQSFANDSFADILSEARKYKLNLTIAHQYVEQMTEMVRAAVFGNVGTTIAFRVGPFDAEILEKMFAPQFTAEDLVNLVFAQVYMSLMIDGVGSTPFSAQTMAPIPRPPISYKQEIIAASRKNFAGPRAEVEEMIRKWHEPLPPPPRPGAKPAVPKPTSATPTTAPTVSTTTTPVSRTSPAPVVAKASAPSPRSEAFKRTPPPLTARPGAETTRAPQMETSRRRMAPSTEPSPSPRPPQKPLSLASLRGGDDQSSLSALRDTLKKAMEGKPATPPPTIDIPVGTESFGDVPTESERDIPMVVARLKHEVEDGEAAQNVSRTAPTASISLPRTPSSFRPQQPSPQPAPKTRDFPRSTSTMSSIPPRISPQPRPQQPPPPPVHKKTVSVDELRKVLSVSDDELAAGPIPPQRTG